MDIDIVIPTRNRLEKLKVCIASINEAIKKTIDTYFKIIVYSNDDREIELLKKIFPPIPYIDIRKLEKEYKAPNFWNDYLKNMKADALCYLNDDIKLDEFCLYKGLGELRKLDIDGVIGFYQSNQTGVTNCGAAFGLIGAKFADRFPNRQVMCPDYWCLYIDEELMKYASSINRFIGSKEAKLEHYHPAFTKEVLDETNIYLRRNKQKDIETYTKRKIKGLLWGESFERVNND